MVHIKDKVSIYIHWPFCKAKCPYCDFNSHVADTIDHNLWRQTFIDELTHYGPYLQDKQVISIFFGGGTPSLAHESVIDGVLSHISTTYNVCSDVEITMEANPTSVEAQKFASVARSGVNRLSLGVQSLKAHHLKFLGREHTAEEALQAIELAAKHFARYSFDLIYALPSQTMDDWQSELQEALALAGGHISLYQLTIEKGTPFFKQHKEGVFTLPDTDVAADMYLKTEELLNASGYQAYEVSNYCMPGHESRHNLQYWQYGEYIGIGPGAHGRITQGGIKYATQNISSPNGWLGAVAQHGIGLQRKDALTASEVACEKVLMGLRSVQGVEESGITNHAALEQMLDSGLLVRRNSRVCATLEGRLVLNSLIAALCIDYSSKLC